jgi:UDP-GlcNAc:undecaprenyl-phosphate GlcNAc-1-phosphate transferase
MSLTIALSFLASALTALGLTPLVIRLARRVGAVDQPDERKVHAYPMPRLGGVAIFFSLFVGLVLFWILSPELMAGRWLVQQRGLVFFLALLAMIALGIWDDVKSLGPARKFLIQLVLSSAVYAAGFKISTITNPFGATGLELNIFDYAATVLWIIGVTNAVNLSDGLDGLASGISIIACLTIGPIALLNNDLGTAILALVLAGALLGFLRYNFNPARIFLGDSGSLGLGFTLAVLSVQSSTKASTVFSIAVPIIALGLPIMDTLLSMIRRLLTSVLPKPSKSGSFIGRLKGMFLPDRAHIHHRLLARGLSHRTAVLVLYLVSCLFGLVAFAITISNNVGASFILLAGGIAAVIGIRQLRYSEMAVLKNGTLLPLYDQPIVNQDTFRSFLDLGFIVVAFWASSYLTDWRLIKGPIPEKMIENVALLAVIQFIVLWSSGLYKGTLRHMGMRDTLQITKSVALAVIAGGILLNTVVTPGTEITISRLVLDFYLLLSLVLGSRASFSILKHFSLPKVNGHRRVLLYGAGPNGAIVLEKILHGELSDLAPLGFLDDDPYLEGKRVHGYPVYGGHWKLGRLLVTAKVDEILIVDEQLRSEVLRRLELFARKHNITLRQMSIALEKVDSVPAVELKQA